MGQHREDDRLGLVASLTWVLVIFGVLVAMVFLVAGVLA